MTIIGTAGTPGQIDDVWAEVQQGVVVHLLRRPALPTVPKLQTQPEFPTGRSRPAHRLETWVEAAVEPQPHPRAEPGERLGTRDVGGRRLLHEHSDAGGGCERGGGSVVVAEPVVGGRRLEVCAGLEVALDLLGVLAEQQPRLRLFIELALFAHALPRREEDEQEDEQRHDADADDPGDPVGGEGEQGGHST